MTAEHRLRPVSREQIARYADAVDDHNPIHVDPAFARSIGLPDVVAHGPLTLTLVLDDLIARGEQDLVALGGRLRLPVVPGDELQYRLTDAGLVVLNQTGATVASVVLEREESPNDV